MCASQMLYLHQSLPPLAYSGHVDTCMTPLVQVLRCLSPWLQHMTFARKWDGTKAGEVLCLAYQMTQKHGQQCPTEVQQLWNTIASNSDNVAVVVDFVIQRSTEELGAESNCRLMVCNLNSKVATPDCLASRSGKPH